MGEFGPGGDNEKPRDERPVRARTVFSDGAVTDEAEFRAYLAKATRDRKTGYGRHGEWDEVWAIAILGQPGDDAGNRLRPVREAGPGSSVDPRVLLRGRDQQRRDRRLNPRATHRNTLVMRR